MNKKVGMLLQKSTDTRGVGISSMRKSIYLLKTTPSSHTHRFSKVKSMDDNCGEWVECMGVVSRRWVWLVGVGGIYGCGYWVWF